MDEKQGHRIAFDDAGIEEERRLRAHQTGRATEVRLAHQFYCTNRPQVRFDGEDPLVASSTSLCINHEVSMSIAPAWQCVRSVEADVPASFAWAYMTDISNWNDPPAEFALEGPFVEGMRGTTRMPGRPLASWTVRDVEPGRGYTIEGGSFLEGAVLLVHWRFDPLSERTARLTQRLELLGENAAASVNEIQSLFEPNMEPGLRNIAQRMAASRETRRARLVGETPTVNDFT